MTENLDFEQMVDSMSQEELQDVIEEGLETALGELEALHDPNDFPNVAIGDLKRAIEALEKLRVKSGGLDSEQMSELIDQGAERPRDVSVSIAPHVAELLGGFKEPYTLYTRQWALIECPGEGCYKLEVYIKVKESSSGIGVVE